MPFYEPQFFRDAEVLVAVQPCLRHGGESDGQLSRQWNWRAIVSRPYRTSCFFQHVLVSQISNERVGEHKTLITKHKVNQGSAIRGSALDQFCPYLGAAFGLQSQAVPDDDCH